LKFVFESIAYLSVNVVIERPVSDTRGGTACCSGQIVGSCNCWTSERRYLSAFRAPVPVIPNAFSAMPSTHSVIPSASEESGAWMLRYVLPDLAWPLVIWQATAAGCVKTLLWLRFSACPRQLNAVPCHRRFLPQVWLDQLKWRTRYLPLPV